MHIENLEWDSKLFGYSVGKVNIESEDDLDFKDLNNDSHKLLYMYSNVALDAAIAKKIGAVTVDKKTELVKDISNQKSKFQNDANVISLHTINEKIISLALQSGIYSRFIQDANFNNNEYEKLYTEWIRKSVLRINAFYVYGFLYNGEIAGFITIGMRNNNPDIGLMVVDEQYRGKKIGTALLNYAKQTLQLKGHKSLTVITQGSNTNALDFYKKNGFMLSNEVYIYHIWK